MHHFHRTIVMLGKPFFQVDISYALETVKGKDAAVLNWYRESDCPFA